MQQQEGKHSLTFSHQVQTPKTTVLSPMRTTSSQVCVLYLLLLLPLATNGSYNTSGSFSSVLLTPGLVSNLHVRKPTHHVVASVLS